MYEKCCKLRHRHFHLFPCPPALHDLKSGVKSGSRADAHVRNRTENKDFSSKTPCNV